ncbi:MAG: hypothetical protein M3M96_04440, partial [Candidatus Eremiobacteraeota bacterium]|nr:hypothetical protein [Candidatus Eremiobacteraeota bacterium]
MKLVELAGVGKESLVKFAELGIVSAQDLLNHFPYRYEDQRYPTDAARLGSASDETAEENAVGTIAWVRERRARNLAIVEAELRDQSGAFIAKWYGRSYLLGSLKAGMRLFVRG